MNTDKLIAESIAKEYAPKTTSKLEALKKLDRKARKGSKVFAYIFGSVMTLVLGVGMCLAMQVIGSGSAMMGAGIVIGLLGILGVSVNYPIYKKLLENSKKKYSFDIMELAKEISEE